MIRECEEEAAPVYDVRMLVMLSLIMVMMLVMMLVMMFISGRASRRWRCPGGGWLHRGSASSGYKVRNDL